jgi:uncharacterized protein (DUF2147 family)
MKKNLSILAFYVLFLCSQLSVAELVNDDAIVGIWLTAEEDGYIRIYKNINTIEGLVFKSFKPEDAQRVDSNNPDPKLRDQSLLGLVILKGFNFDGFNSWTGGQVYDPNTGITYQAKLELIDDNKLALRGYVGIPLFGHTENWTRKN